MKIKVNNLNLYDTLMSGQCFRMILESDNSFTVILKDRVVNLLLEGEYLSVTSNNMNDLENVIRSYLDLDLDTNYEEINSYLCKNKVIKENIHLCKGYKILNQDKFEMFITYIISQNNNVKRIINSVNKLSEKYGEKVIFNNKEYFLFPKFEDIKDISVEELRSFGVGFRDKYIISALNVLKSDPLYLNKLENMSTQEAIKSLTLIKGIGVKVASCILLFGYHRFDTFPVDTWVKKFVSENFGLKDDIKVISDYMMMEFKQYSGLAIQYFYHINRNKIKK